MATIPSVNWTHFSPAPMLGCCRCLLSGVTGPPAMLVKHSETTVWLLQQHSTGEPEEPANGTGTATLVWTTLQLHSSFYSSSENYAVREGEVIIWFERSALNDSLCRLTENAGPILEPWGKATLLNSCSCDSSPCHSKRKWPCPQSLSETAPGEQQRRFGLTITQRQRSRVELSCSLARPQQPHTACTDCFSWDILQATCSAKEHGKFPWSVEMC